MTVLQRARDIGMYGCTSCALVVSRKERHLAAQRCPRCRSPLRERERYTRLIAWVPLMLAMTCYASSFFFPIMLTTTPGTGEHASTILSGISKFWREGSPGVAALILFASVIIPCAKFLALASLLVSVQCKASWWKARRAQIHGVLAALGHGSTIDVLLVGLLASIVQFEAWASVAPAPAIVLFCLSVVLTTVASYAFDPRSIWDAAGEAA